MVLDNMIQTCRGYLGVGDREEQAYDTQFLLTSRRFLPSRTAWCRLRKAEWEVAALGVASFPGSRNACSLSSWRTGIWSDSNSIIRPDDCGKTENKWCGKPTVLDLNTGPSSASNGLSKDQHLCVLSVFLSSPQKHEHPTQTALRRHSGAVQNVMLQMHWYSSPVW